MRTRTILAASAVVLLAMTAGAMTTVPVVSESGGGRWQSGYAATESHPMLMQIYETDATGTTTGAVTATRYLGPPYVGLFAWADMPATQFRVRVGTRPVDAEGLPTGELPTGWACSELADFSDAAMYTRQPVSEPGGVGMVACLMALGLIALRGRGGKECQAHRI